MIKEIDRSHPPSRIWSARGHYNRGNPDTWLFYFAAGDFKEAWEHLPHLHEYVLWHRSKKDKTYLLPITTFWRRFVNHGKLQFSETSAAAPTSA
jgi:hypothetical protein